MDLSIQSNADLSIFQLHTIFGEYLKHVHPNDNGITVYPTWTNQEGITIHHLKNLEFIVEV